jgi:hypothetical protein
VGSISIETQVGATFAVPLVDGQFGAVRIVGVDRKKNGGGAWFAATEYVGPKPPRLDEPSLARIQILDTSGFSVAPRPCVWWQPAAEPPPANFPFLGLVKMTAAENRSAVEQGMEWHNTWEKWAAIILHQWRWDHDRKGMIWGKYDKEMKAASAKRRRSEKTLAELRQGPFFKTWDEFVPARVTRAARTIAREAVDGLIELGPKPTKKKALPILRKFIESFNEMCTDIDTVSREEILDLFDEMVDAANLKGCDELAEKWRDF